MEEKIKFEDQIKELEEIVNELENGDIDLDKSIEKYTHAMNLVASCDEKLKEIDKKISKLVTKDDKQEEFEVEWKREIKDH